MVGDKLQQKCLWCGPGKRLAGCRKRPGPQIGEIGGEGAQRIRSHPLIPQVAQRLDLLICQEFGQLVAPVCWQNGRDRIELLGATFDGIHPGRPRPS